MNRQVVHRLNIHLTHFDSLQRSNFFMYSAFLMYTILLSYICVCML